MKPYRPGDPEIELLEEIEEIATVGLDWDCMTVGTADGIQALVVGTAEMVEHIRSIVFEEANIIDKDKLN